MATKKLTEDERAARAWDRARVDLAALVAALAAHHAGVDGTYTVQPGDTLDSIAAAIYGADGLPGALYDANRAIGSDPAALAPGTVLAVPAPTFDPSDDG